MEVLKLPKKEILFSTGDDYTIPQIFLIRYKLKTRTEGFLVNTSSGNIRIAAFHLPVCILSHLKNSRQVCRIKNIVYAVFKHYQSQLFHIDTNTWERISIYIEQQTVNYKYIETVIKKQLGV